MSKPISDPVFDIGRDLQRAYDEGYKQGRYDEKVAAIKAVPSADRPQGEWVDEGDPLTIRCSKCDYRAARYNNTNYCPNCGVYMKEVDDDIH